MTAASHPDWLSRWVRATSIAAVAATIVDALLLQVRRSYFTGGFLSDDHVATAGQATAFVAGSLIADIAVVAGPAAMTLWLAARVGLSRRVGAGLAVLVSLAPIVAADFVAYRLQSFLGDAFDLNLMFALVGRDPAEILAVSAARLVSLGAIAFGAALVIAITVIAMRRRRPRLAARVQDRPGEAFIGRTIATWLLLLAVSSAACAVLRLESDVVDNGLKRKPSGRALGMLVELISDVDRDGFGVLGRFSDPAPFDARIYPFAVDHPGNGLDENGVGGDLPAGLPRYEEPGLISAPLTGRSLLMIGLESFRADVLAANVHGRPATPTLASLAASGVSVAQAFSHNGYTVQSRRHIFSGSVADLTDHTLIDDFKAAGYQTAYISGQDETFGGDAGDVGFNRADVSYDARREPGRRYTTFTTAGSLAVPYTVIVEQVTSFLKKREADRPLFLYVNFHDTHFPYHHRFNARILDTPVLTESEIVPARAEDLRLMYLNTAANVDRAMGHVIEAARAALGQDVGIIVLADHGESLFDEGFLGHGYALNDAQTRIPLVVSNLPMVIRQPFAQSDLRGEILAAMSNPSHEGPRVVVDTERTVFQYLGTVDQPAQIASIGAKRRVVYDFRTRRVQVGQEPWRTEAALDATARAKLLDLIHGWERMIVARSARRR